MTNLNLKWIKTNNRSRIKDSDALSLVCADDKQGNRNVTLTLYPTFAEQIGVQVNQRALIGFDMEAGKVAVLFGDKGNKIKDIRTRKEKDENAQMRLSYTVRVCKSDVPLFARCRYNVSDVQQDGNMIVFDMPEPDEYLPAPAAA